MSSGLVWFASTACLPACVACGRDDGNNATKLVMAFGWMKRESAGDSTNAINAWIGTPGAESGTGFGLDGLDLGYAKGFGGGDE